MPGGGTHFLKPRQGPELRGTLGGIRAAPLTPTAPNPGAGAATCTETRFYPGSASGAEAERCATRSCARLAGELAAGAAAEPGLAFRGLPEASLLSLAS